MHKKRRPGQVRFPSTEYVEAYDQAISRLLAVIAEVRQIPGIANAWVSDRSSVGDFFFPDGSDHDVQLAEISRRLGLLVKYDDNLVALARRIATSQS
jgi:hypothetical protein